jgi:hypothetical protein
LKQLYETFLAFVALLLVLSCDDDELSEELDAVLGVEPSSLVVDWVLVRFMAGLLQLSAADTDVTDVVVVVVVVVVGNLSFECLRCGARSSTEFLWWLLLLLILLGDVSAVRNSIMRKFVGCAILRSVTLCVCD